MGREPNLDDTHNGHSDPLADADTMRLDPLPWPPPKRHFDRVRQIMSGRVQSRPREAEVQPLTRVPGWLTGLACSALVIAGTQTGYLIYRISHYDTVETQTKDRFSDIYDDLRAQDQYNQLVTIYENKVQQLLIERARLKPSELPPIPVRPTLGKPRPRREGD